MKRRIFTSLAAATAVAASILISSAAPAAAQPPTADSSAAARSSAVTANSTLKETPIYVDDTKFKIVATLKGIGKQVYDCKSGGSYTFREPIAVLVNLRSGDAGIHGKGPFWASFDGSRVEGTGAGSIPSPAGAANIPWLKVAATSNAGVNGVFSNVKFIQRLDTRGGAAPTTPCTADSTASVDYTTNYVFWAAK